MTIYLQWWMLPALVTLLTYGFTVWRISTAKTSGDYGHIGQALAFVAMLCASTIISLMAWLLWALLT
tara:strand:+ start:10566 stop:10766 length:201 start_codon:yes stop_codon:yes gene_type:complete